MIYDYIIGGTSDTSMENQTEDYASAPENEECFEDHDMGDRIKKSTDVIIVGSGVAGSALAYALAKDGREVHVIERDLTEPNSLADELLQPGGYQKLVELGLEDCVTEIDAQEIHGYVAYKDGRYIEIPYPSRNAQSNLAGRGFHNGRFVQKMRKKVTSLPNVRMEEGTVTALLNEQGTVKGVQYITKSGQETNSYAPLTFVCDGCNSVLRRSLSDAEVKVTSYIVGWIKENCQLPYNTNHGLTIFSDPSCLSYPLSSTETRYTVIIPGQKLPSIANGDLYNYLTKLAPQLSPELYSALMPEESDHKEKIRATPCCELTVPPYHTPGALLLGDAYNIRHPFTGGGMTVALSDVVVIRDLLRPLTDLTDTYAVRRHLQSFYTLREPVASTINTVAACTYKLLSSDPTNEALKDLQDVLLDYLSLGSGYASGLMGLQSGLSLDPWNIILTWGSLGAYTICRLLFPFPTPRRIQMGAELIWLAVTRVSSIIMAHKGKNMSSPVVGTGGNN